MCPLGSVDHRGIHVPRWIVDACDAERLTPLVARPTRTAMHFTALIARPGALKWYVELDPDSNNRSLRNSEKRRENLKVGEALQCDPLHALERLYEFRATIRVDRMVARMRAECHDVCRGSHGQGA